MIGSFDDIKNFLLQKNIPDFKKIIIKDGEFVPDFSDSIEGMSCSENKIYFNKSNRIHLVSVVSEESSPGSTQMHLNHDEKFEIIEQTLVVGSNKNSKRGSHYAVTLNEGAQVSWLSFLLFDQDESYEAQKSFLMKKESSLEQINVSCGGRLNQSLLNFKMSEPGSELKLFGAYLGKGSERQVHKSTVQHQSGSCRTEQLYKGILKEESKVAFDGLVHIERGAQKADSSQLNSTLLLSTGAEIKSQPQLKIDADDVKATHGSTVGEMDPEELFYLTSRGIKFGQAKRMLMNGFVVGVLDQVKNQNLKEIAQKEIQRVLNQYF